MDENKPYEPIKIEIEVGRSANPMTITDGLIRYLVEMYTCGFTMDANNELLMYEDIRMIGEALLSVYESHRKHEEFREIYRR